VTVLGIGCAAALLSLLAMRATPLRVFDLLLTDISARISPAKAQPDDVIVVNIDERSFAAVPKATADWQPTVAQVVRLIAKQHPKSIGIDVMFGTPDERSLSEARELAQAAQDAEQAGAPVFFGFDASTGVPSQASPLYMLTSAQQRLGFVNLAPDVDDALRRATPCKADDREPLTSLGVQVAIAASGRQFTCASDHVTLSGEDFPLSADHSMPIRELQHGPTSISFADLLAPSPDPQMLSRFTGKIVLIGTDVRSDRHATPLIGGAMERAPGVDVHAAIAEDFFHGHPLRTVPASIAFLVALLTAFCYSALALAMRWKVSAAFSTTLLPASILPSVLAFSAGHYMRAGPVAMSAALAVLGTLAFRYEREERRHREIRRQFSRYLSPELVEQISRSGVSLDGERKKITALFSDIRGFTTLSEQISPENLVPQLNEYLSAMTEVIIQNNGYLDKFIGDGIFAFFGAPVELKDAAWHALKTATQMLERLAELNAKWKAEGRPQLNIGIGLHTGDAIVGNVGGARKLEYTAIGDTVNTAARVESKTKDSIQRYNAHILISGVTLDELERWDHFVDVFAMEIDRLKGKHELTQLFVLRGLYGKGRKGSAANA